MLDTFYCVDCEQTKPVQHDGGTGYAVLPDSRGKICYACVAERDRQIMISTGTSDRLPLYMARHAGGEYYVSNWPGSLRFSILRNRFGRHNIARTRHDAWFVGPDKYVWHGVVFGEWTQVFHARRTKVSVGAVQAGKRKDWERF